MPTFRYRLPLALALGLLLVLLVPAVVSADPGDVGLPGPSTQGAAAAASGSKPESKLWQHDGAWWASLWDTATSRFAIWRLPAGATTWVRTPADVDTRPSSRSDALWDGTKLYIASYQFSEATGSGAARLLRYSYDTAADRYTLDSGFPATISSARAEALTIAKDSTGQLWATWETGGRIWVNRTTTGDAAWGAPFVLPGSTTVDSDDISTIVAFGGDRIGVLWSDQTEETDHFAVHLDSAADTTWRPVEDAFVGPDVADDHLNLKADATGRVYAAVKTSVDGDDPLIVVLVRQANGTWSDHPVAFGPDQTRPILLIDQAHGLLRVFYSDDASGGAIMQQTSPISSVSFPGGAGTVVARDADANDLNNVTSTKQTITSETGLVILATNDSTRQYWFSEILAGAQPPGDTTPPTRTGLSIDGATLTLTYSEALDPDSTPATGTFAATVNGSARGVTEVVVDGSTVTLTLAARVISTDVVTLAYAPAGQRIQDVAGNDAAGFAATAVDNVTPPAPPVEHPFTDIDGSAFAEDIAWLYAEGITAGCAPTRYCPDAPVTREEMAIFLDRALELDATDQTFFTDDDGRTGEPAIDRLAAAGITGGCGPTTYCPTATVTRGQMASFLARAFDLPTTTTDWFTDDDGTTHERDIDRLAESGITTGCGPETFCPAAQVTRGEMAAFLHRALRGE